jgi:hypothetical protein
MEWCCELHHGKNNNNHGKIGVGWLPGKYNVAREVARSWGIAKKNKKQYVHISEEGGQEPNS